MSTRNKYFIIFLVLTVITIGVILAFTGNQKTIAAVSRLKLQDLAILTMLWFISLLFDALAIYFLVMATGEKISVYASVQTSAIKYFFNMITPFSFGGQPVMIYFLSKHNIPTGKSSSVVMTKLLFSAGWVFVGALIAFYFNAGLITSQTTVLIFFIVAAVLQTAFLSSIVIIMLFPHLFFGFFLWIGKIGQKIKIFKKTVKLKKNLIRESAGIRRSFKHYFKKHFILLFLGVLSNGISYASLLIMLYYVFHSFGYSIPVGEAMSFTALLFLIMGFFPTPGASGFAEGLFILMVSHTIPLAILGVSVVTWRFFTQYLSIIPGFWFTVKHLSEFILEKKK